MNETKISWTTKTWNPVHGCSIVSDGCKHCYAMELSLKRGWTTEKWTIQNEDQNVMIKPHKLDEPYKDKDLKATPSRIFVNSMSDLFHRAIPDWYRAVVFLIMLDLDQHVFQVLTKRPALTIDWHERFHTAIESDEFKHFCATYSNKHVSPALAKRYDSPWGKNIWMGTSVEDGRVIGRIDELRRNKAQIRFISAEPLLGPYPADTDLSGIHWVIVGGESGSHMGKYENRDDNPRWMKQEWARGIKRLCVDQAVAFFYKQDSGHVTELRTYLFEEDASCWAWEQYPGDLRPPVPVDTQHRPSFEYRTDFDNPNATLNQCLEQAQLWESTAYQWGTTSFQLTIYAENAAIAAAWWYAQAANRKPRKPQYQGYADDFTDYDMPWPEYTHPANAHTHTILVHTARIDCGDPDAIDITMKSAGDGAGSILAPTKELVFSHKAGKGDTRFTGGYSGISDEEYTARYTELLRDRYRQLPSLFHRLLERDRIVLTCYCPDGDFCHRHLAVDILAKIAESRDVIFVRGGELERVKPEKQKEADQPQQMTLFDLPTTYH